MLWIALAAMIVATTAHHLGFAEAAYAVAGKVAKCPKCLSFWCALCALMLSECNPLVAVGLSFLSAYLSFWWGLALIVLNNLYNGLWQRITNQPNPQGGKGKRPVSPG